ARRVLDLGTGSGVLAIAAARALRLPVLASDLDRLAVRTARQNARLNRVGGLVEVISASGLAAQRFRDRGPFDLIFANILLRPLQQLAAPLARLAAPGARIVLSGLLPGQASAALASYRAQGLVLQSRLLVENWATLVLVRPRGRYQA
ncbi:MAG TPA: 50S ribosomal protein L11 methyltransferase, partial [Xanthobacteraceae bacterium]